MSKPLLTKPLQFFRYGPTQIYAEATLHQTSLMARVSLGPSVAPRPVESSTVHGVTLVWVKSFCLTKSEILGLFLPVPDSRGNQAKKKAALPVTLNLTPIYAPLPRSRRHTIFIRTCKRELGFHLVGFFFKFGPSAKIWPITKYSGFTTQLIKPRSVLLFNLLSPIPLLSCFSNLCGRRLHMRMKSDSMFWVCYHHLRSLPLPARLISDLKQNTFISTIRIKILQRNFHRNFSRSRTTRPSGRILHQIWKSDSLHWPLYYHQRTLYSRSVRASKRLPNLMYSSQSWAKSGCPLFFTTYVSEAAARNCSKLLCDIDLNQGALVLFSSSMVRSFSSTSSSMERTLLILSSLMERSLSSTSSFMERTIPLNSSFMESVFKSSALMAPRAQISVCSPSLAEKHLKTIFKLIKSEASLLESTRDFICLSIFFHVYVFLIHFVISENYRASSSLAKNLLMTIVTPI